METDWTLVQETFCTFRFLTVSSPYPSLEMKTVNRSKAYLYAELIINNPSLQDQTDLNSFLKWLSKSSDAN